MSCGLLCKYLLTVLTVCVCVCLCVLQNNQTCCPAQHRPTTAKKVGEVCSYFHSAVISSSFFCKRGFSLPGRGFIQPDPSLSFAASSPNHH